MIPELFLLLTAAAAQNPKLPMLTIDPPEGFYRNIASGPNVDWYDSFIVNATLRIYPFRAVTGDAASVFQKTLFLDWTPLDVPQAALGPPAFDRGTMPGADAV